MSCTIATTSLTRAQSRQAFQDLVVTEDIKYGSGIKTYYLYYLDKKINIAFLPMFYAQNTLKLKRLSKDNFQPIADTASFIGELRDDQKEAKRQIMISLNKSGTALVSLHVGFGKSILAIYLAIKLIRLQTIVLNNRIVILDQWERSFSSFASKCVVQRLKNNIKRQTDADIYIANMTQLAKLDLEGNKIGCVIIDEAHSITQNTYTQILRAFSPRYLLLLTATGYRLSLAEDKLFDVLVDRSEQVQKSLYKEHTVFKINTNILLEVSTTFIDDKEVAVWNETIDLQSTAKRRLDILVEVIEGLAEDQYALVLVKRVEFAKLIASKLSLEKEQCLILTGNIAFKHSSKQYKVIIATFSKVAVGFDVPYLNTLVLANDLKDYFIQSLGRVFRVADKKHRVEVYDLVDKMRLLSISKGGRSRSSGDILKKHWEAREAIYLECGGEVVERTYEGSLERVRKSRTEVH